MHVIVRKTTDKDFPALLTLLEEFARFQKTPEKFTNSLERMQEERDFFNALVAENEQQEIVGFATYYFAYFSWSGKGMFLDDLYIKPAFRGQGIGGKLMQTIIAIARRENCHKLHWQVSHWNQPAIEYYESLGASFDHTEMNCEISF